ncbi:MAG: hypothetical protein SWE60_20110, partial [Thermodesulfobacteriota bacterium]|nr:hypothetical protein [Thermodesulfobacteriota bacterium]
MKQGQPAKKPARKGKQTPHNLFPILPGKGSMGRLKDMAQEIISASAGLEGRVAAETALVLGDRLRLINSYYSNLIEGHRTTIPDIEAALRKDFHQDPEKQYAQELCAAHVETERRFMQGIEGGHGPNICNKRYLCDMHGA